MKKIFSCSTSQFPVDKWNKHDQKLFEAVEKGDTKKLSAILSKRPIRATKNGPNGQSAFHVAAAKGLIDCVNVIISHKVEINAKTDDGCTALHLASSNCHPECVKVLLQHGAHEDSIDFQGRTPLHCAATSGCVSSVLHLCNAEDTILDATDDDGRTPLMIAAQRNHPTVCSLLLDRGAQVDMTDREKKTALILACERGNIQAAETLLTKGAEPDMKDNKGCDALSYASLTRDEALRKLVQAALDRRKSAHSTSPQEGQPVCKVLHSPTHRDQEVIHIWKKRYEEEHKRGVWLQGELMTKTQEIDRIAEERRLEDHQIRELTEKLEGLLDGQLESPGANAEVPYLDTCSLLAQVLDRVGTLKDEISKEHLADERIKVLASKVAENENMEDQHIEEARRLQEEISALKEKEEGARRKVTELEGHLDNMREVLSQFEKRKRIQSTVVEDLQEQISEVTREKEELLMLLHKLQGQEENMDSVNTKRLGNGETFVEHNALKEFLKKLKSNCVNVEVRQNNDALNRHSGYVPKDLVEKGAEDWKKTIDSVERYIVNVENSQQHLTSLGRTDSDLVNGSTNEPLNVHRSLTNFSEHCRPIESNVPCLQEDVTISKKNSLAHQNSAPPHPDTQTSDHARRIDSLKQIITGLEKELSSFKENHGNLLTKMNRVIQEKQNLEEGLLALQESMQSEYAMRQETELRCKDYKHQIGVLSDELAAEKDKLKKLNGRLEAQKNEMSILRDSFPPEVLQEENNRTSQVFSSDILEELYWNVGTLVKKYNDAQQQVNTLQKENIKLLDDQAQKIALTEHKNILNETKNELQTKVKETEDLRQRLFQAMGTVVELKKQLAVLTSNSVSKEEVENRMQELEKVVLAFKEENDACKVALEGKCEEVLVLKQQLEQEAEERRALQRKEEISVQECDRLKGDLESQLRALREEVQVLSRDYSKTTEEANRCKDLLASEQEKVMSLQGKIKEIEKEDGDLKAKVQRQEEEISQLREKHDQLSRASQEKQEELEKSMKEVKSLTKEIEELQKRSNELMSQLEDTNRRHQETVTTYRTHLLNAAQGYMDEDVHLTLRWILKMQNDLVY
ncbi:ankyrin repeat domain-containing protein 35 isoform X2 [Hyperolius riggenbachi]|uniref:ankyrin repeat domain-containing protein 35 isoform X2 n=1 Tax=Hyperolius riggenbachi TaxID=752182 RepID=UPI0035A38C4A